MNHLLAATSNSSTLNNVEPGVLGFIVVAALAVALVFLLRSMNKQFKKIGPKPEDLEDAEATLDEALVGDESGQAVAKPAVQESRTPQA